jgi:hypothetical protein
MAAWVMMSSVFWRMWYQIVHSLDESIFEVGVAIWQILLFPAANWQCKWCPVEEIGSLNYQWMHPNIWHEWAHWVWETQILMQVNNTRYMKRKKICTYMNLVGIILYCISQKEKVKMELNCDLIVLYCWVNIEKPQKGNSLIQCFKNKILSQQSLWNHMLRFWIRVNIKA